MTSNGIEIVNDIQRFIDRSRFFLHDEKVSPLYLSLCSCNTCGSNDEGTYRILRDTENGFDPSFVWQYKILGAPDSPKEERDWHPTSPKQTLLECRTIKVPIEEIYSLAERIAMDKNMSIEKINGRVNSRDGSGRIYKTTVADSKLWGRTYIIGGRR